MISFGVCGIPRSKGSMRHVGHGRMIESNRGVTEWIEAVGKTALHERQAQAQYEILEGPVSVRLAFFLPRPKSEPKRRVTWPDRRPDLDKMTRAILDALTGILYADDGQVTYIVATKAWAESAATVGVAIHVERAEFDHSFSCAPGGPPDPPAIPPMYQLQPNDVPSRSSAAVKRPGRRKRVRG